MRATAPRLVGRHDELDTVVRLLDVPEDLPGGVVLRGEAGIGKTTVWLAGLDAAAERGYQVLTSRPSDAESGFSFSGLADLLDPFATDVLSELPPVQRRALEAALLLGDPDVPTDDRAVAVAFLEVVRRLSRGGPLCIAIDDVQWLDTASVAALRYALGRLETMPVAALLAVRGELPPWLRRVAPEGPLRTVDVDGLSVGATYELLRVHLDVTFPRPTLIKIWETSGGNPFFALELSRALKTRGGPLTPGEELPIPADLDELLRARLDALSASALEVAQVVACLAEPTVSRVEAAGGDGANIGLDEALGARGSSSWTAIGCGSPIHYSAPQPWRISCPRVVARCTHGSRRSCRRARSARGIWRSRRPGRAAGSRRLLRTPRDRHERAALRRRRRSWRSRPSG